MSNISNNEHKVRITKLAVYAALVYLTTFLLGALIQFFYSVPVEANSLSEEIGFFLTIAGPLLIFWSQKNIRYFRAEAKSGRAVTSFARGPYRYMRNPTYLGLTLLIAGFGFFANSLFVVLGAILAFLIINFTILRKEERFLEERYGDIYREYKKAVRKWL